MGNNIFFRFFAGIPMEEMDTFPLPAFGCWLFPIGVYLLSAGFYLGIARKNRQFVLVRYGRIQKWWRHYFFKNMFCGGVAAAALLLFGGIIGLLVSRHLPGSVEEIVMVSVLWTVHMLAFLALFLFLETADIRKPIPPVLLLLEGMTFFYGCRNKAAARFLFGTWGMYAQSGFYDSVHGFWAAGVTAVQAACIFGCYLMGSYMLRRRKMEGVL